MQIIIEPLTIEAFKPFGDVIQASKVAEIANHGTADRTNFITQLVNTRDTASANVCVFHSRPQKIPFEIKLLERHKYSTQLFVPMTDRNASYLVIVALCSNNQPDITTLRAFLATSKQAFNYNKGTWHHPMIALENPIDFTCIVYEAREKSENPTDDCEEFYFKNPIFAIQGARQPKLLQLDSFKSYPDLAVDSCGGKILFSTDDFFATAENLISNTEPIWDENKYTIYGKWMDGWETRRKRTAGHDWCIIKLGLPGQIVGVLADTAFFTGNNVPAFSIQAFHSTKPFNLTRRSEMGTCCTMEELKAAEAIGSDQWETVLFKTNLGPGYPETRHHVLKVNSEKTWTHIRVNIFPDGGLSRLRVFGIVRPDWEKIKGTIDLASIENGATALNWSNAHYGNPMRLLQPARSLGMFDGWETARNPNRPHVYLKDDNGQLIIPGNEWAIIRLAKRGLVEKVVVDTLHYKGNYPESCELLYCDSLSPPDETTDWKILCSRSRLSSHCEHELKISTKEYITHVKLIMYPDGGISRLRLFGKAE